MKHHPKRNEYGEEVVIHNPSYPTFPELWYEPTLAASTVPDYQGVPSKLNGITVAKYEEPKSWVNVDGQGDFSEPDFPPHPLLNLSAGVIMVEPDNRVWVIHPTNGFGGYEATFPKGQIDYGLTPRESALKEAYEESGLKAELISHLGDFLRTTSIVRFYIGKRVAGHPSDMGWESQKVSLIPMKELHKVLTHQSDQAIIAAIYKHYRI